MDQLTVEALASTLTAEEIAGAVDEYLEIGAFLDAGLMQQVAPEHRARIEGVSAQFC